MNGRISFRIVAFLLFGALLVAAGHMLADGLRHLQAQALDEEVGPEPDAGSYRDQP